MRALCVMGLSLALACGAAAEDKKGAKIDGKKLLGKWEQAEQKSGALIVIEYAADGKFACSVLVDGRTGAKITGAYRLDGRALAMTARTEDEKGAATSPLVLGQVTVTKLTDDELAIETPKGEKFALKRVKEKDK